MNAFVPVPSSSALRRGRTNDAGNAYLITTSTSNRAPVFSRSTYATTAAAVLNNASTSPHACILIWILMPDHLHLLLELGDVESLSRTVGRIKAAIGRCFPSSPESLWQPSFHDHVLRKEEDIGDVSRYLLLNPVRAGLVQRFSDWPWRGGQLIKQMEIELAWQEPGFD